jgi:hypothetical protein
VPIGYHMSADCVVSMLINDNDVAGEPGLHDIGGTNAETAWVSMEEFEHVFAYVQLGTWNAGDDLDECKLQQASDSAGTGIKDLTTDASGGNYDTDNPIDAAGNFVILEAKKEDFDVAGGFKYVRLYVAEGGNTGTDNVAGFLIRCCAANKRKQLQGAAVVGEKVYVRPS